MRHLLALGFLLIVSSTAAAQGAIAITPVVPASPPTIAGYNPGGLDLQFANGKIVLTLVAPSSSTQTQAVVWPDDCIALGQSAPGSCATRDTAAEVQSLITTLNTTNLTTRSLWRRAMDLVCADFLARFPGCTVQ